MKLKQRINMNDRSKYLVGGLCFVLFVVVITAQNIQRPNKAMIPQERVIRSGDQCNGKVVVKTFRFWDCEHKFADPEVNIFHAVREFSRTHDVLSQRHVSFELLPWLSYIELVVCERKGENHDGM